MNDQANQLRQLMIREALLRADRDGCAAIRVHFCSGQRGVGTSMVALNSAMALARSGHRVVLVTSRLEQAEQLASFRNTIQQIPDTDLDGKLFVGPFGLAFYEPGASGVSQARLVQIADFMLLDIAVDDVESKPGSSDAVVYVTTTDNASVLETYALMKSHSGCGPCLVVANRAETEQEGWEVLERFRAASVDLSNFELNPAAVIPIDASGQVTQGAAVIQSPTSDLAKRFEAVAESISRLRKVEGEAVAKPLDT